MIGHAVQANVLEKYTRRFSITSRIGLHGRPAEKIAHALEKYIVTQKYIDEADILGIDQSGKRHHLHYPGRSAPCLSDFTDMGLGEEAELVMTLKTNKDVKYVGYLFNAIEKILEKRYFRNEDKAEKLNLVCSSN